MPVRGNGPAGCLMALYAVESKTALVLILICVTTGAVQKTGRQILPLIETGQIRCADAPARQTVPILIISDQFWVQLRRLLKPVGLKPRQMAMIHLCNQNIPTSMLNMTTTAAADRRMKIVSGLFRRLLFVAWQAMQLIRSGPFVGVWQALQSFSRRSCPAESAPGMVNFCQVLGSFIRKPSGIGTKFATRAMPMGSKKSQTMPLRFMTTETITVRNKFRPTREAKADHRKRSKLRYAA